MDKYLKNEWVNLKIQRFSRKKLNGFNDLLPQEPQLSFVRNQPPDVAKMP